MGNKVVMSINEIIFVESISKAPGAWSTLHGLWGGTVLAVNANGRRNPVKHAFPSQWRVSLDLCMIFVWYGAKGKEVSSMGRRQIETLMPRFQNPLYSWRGNIEFHSVVKSKIATFVVLHIVNGKQHQMLALSPWVLAKKKFIVTAQLQAKVYLEGHRGRIEW